MSRSVIVCVLFEFIAVVTTTPTIPYDFSQALIVDINPEVQSTFQLRDPFGLANTSKTNYDAANLYNLGEGGIGHIKRFTFGKRIQDDSLVSSGGDNKQFKIPQNVDVTIKYPTTGKGAIISYVEVVVNQSVKKAQAAIVSGGIKQRSIAIGVQANTTFWFGYTISIYGH